MKRLAILLAVVLSFSVAPAFAASSPVTITYCNHYFYSLIYATASGTPPNGCIYANSYDSSYSPAFVEYRYASVSAGGPFVNDLKWVSSGSGSNLTAMSGTSGSTATQVTFNMGGMGDLFYYFPANVTQVEWLASGSSGSPSLIPSASFITSQSSFSVASSPKVFSNSTFVEVGTPGAGTVYFDINGAVPPNNGGSSSSGSSGGGGAGSNPPPAQAIKNAASIAGIGVVILVAVIAGGYVSNYLGGKKGWGSPKKGNNPWKILEGDHETINPENPD